MDICVTIEPNNGARRTKVYVKRGAKLPVPVEPVREGYTFEGWFVDERLSASVGCQCSHRGGYDSVCQVEQGGSSRVAVPMGMAVDHAPGGDDGTAPEVIPPSDQGESAGQQAGGSQVAADDRTSARGAPGARYGKTG